MWYRFARADSFYWFLARVVLLYMSSCASFNFKMGLSRRQVIYNYMYFAALVLQVKFIVLKAAYPSCDSTRAVFFTSNIAALDFASFSRYFIVISF
jgi:hypothetical protein